MGISNMKETIKIDENKLPEDVQHQYRIKKLLSKREDIKESVRDDFLNFVKYVWPDFVEGPTTGTSQISLINCPVVK